MRAERIRGAVILAGAFLLAAGVGLAMAVGFDDETSRPIEGAALPLRAVAPPTMPVNGLAALHGRPPVKPLPRRRHARQHRVVAVAATAPAPAPVAPRVAAAPRPAAVAPAPVLAPKPAPALKPAPAPAPARKPAPVVFDDSA